jgi:hypothetical protein
VNTHTHTHINVIKLTFHSLYISLSPSIPTPSLYFSSFCICISCSSLLLSTSLCPSFSLCTFLALSLFLLSFNLCLAFCFFSVFSFFLFCLPFLMSLSASFSLSFSPLSQLSLSPPPLSSFLLESHRQIKPFCP